MISRKRDLPMLLRRLPVLIATPLARSPQRVARANAARAALEARQRRHEREDVEAFLDRVLLEKRARVAGRPPR
jgi:hypothetical protein